MTLPVGWSSAEVRELVDLVNGYAFKPTDWGKGGRPIIRIQNLNRADAPFNYFDGTLPKKYLVHHGDLLFAWSGTPGTSFGAHVWHGGEAWLNQHIFNVRFDERHIDKRFLRLAINQNLADYVRAAHGGAGLAHITKGVFEQSRLLIPPLPEQRRIVAEIETQFTRLDAAVAALERARANLMRYRAGILIQAARGREPSQDHFGRDEPTNDCEQEIPPDWNWVQMREAGEVQLGRQRSPTHHDGLNMRPYLRVANVYENRLDLSDVKEMNFTPREFERYELRPGDILLNEGQSIEWVGRPAMYNGEIKEACYQNTLVRFRAAKTVDPRFALIVFRAYLHDGTFQRIARWTVNIAHLGSERFAVTCPRWLVQAL